MIFSLDFGTPIKTFLEYAVRLMLAIRNLPRCGCVSTISPFFHLEKSPIIGVLRTAKYDLFFTGIELIQVSAASWKPQALAVGRFW